MIPRSPRAALTSLLVVATALGAAATFAAIPTTDARIVEVTVYRDRAEVVRESRVSVPAGASAVEFADIPIGVEPDSLRVNASGVPATLGAVEIAQRVESREESAELDAARKAVEDLEWRIAELAAGRRVDTTLNEFLDSLQAATAERTGRELGEGRADVEALQGFYAMLRERKGELSAADLDRTRRKTRLDEELRVAKERLAILQPGRAIRSRSATVQVEAGRAGELTLRLTYVAPNASWRPSYRATLDPTSGDLELVSEGVVRQQTGEDWRGVTLRLSTAAPAEGLEPPMLTSWVVRPVVPRPQAAEREGFLAEEGAPAEFDFIQNTTALAPGVGDDSAAAIAQAAMLTTGYSVAYAVPGRADVPPDGSDHRVALRTDTLASNLAYRVVPGLESRAYLTAVTTSPADRPLLAGPVRVFAEGAYLGAYLLNETGPGVELTLPLGTDNRLEVVRVRQPQSAGRGGFGGGKREVEFAFTTRLHNLRDRAVTVVLEDRVPVAEDERIEVEIDTRRTTPGAVDSPRRPGVKLWTLEMAPGEERTIEFAYTVRHPRELNVPLDGR